MAPKKGKTAAAPENVSLGPQVREGMPPALQQIAKENGQTRRKTSSTNTSPQGELVFGVARIFASFNDTFVHVTDLRFVNITPAPAP